MALKPHKVNANVRYACYKPLSSPLKLQMLTYGQGQLIWKIFLSALCPVTSGGDALEPKDCGILFTSQNPLLQLRPVPMCTDPLVLWVPQC